VQEGYLSLTGQPATKFSNGEEKKEKKKWKPEGRNLKR